MGLRFCFVRLACVQYQHAGSPKQIVVAVAQGSLAAMTAFEELQAKGLQKTDASAKKS